MDGSDGADAEQWKRCLHLLQSITDEWDFAEQDIKLAEQISNKVVFPSIKELRYAGRRLLEIIKLIASENDLDLDEVETLCRDVRFDCHRARHDAIDAGTAKIAADLQIMTQKLGYGPIIKMYPEFGSLHRALNEIREQIAASRANTANRNFIYREIESGAFPSLVAKFLELQSAEGAIKALAKGERRDQFTIKAVGTIEFFVLMFLVIDNFGAIRSFITQLWHNALHVMK